MPCYDSRDHEPRVVYKSGYDPSSAEVIANLRKRLDNLTDLLCKTGRARKNRTNIPPEVIRWWNAHCKWDAKRGEPW